MSIHVAIIDSGVANLASVQSALAHLGAPSVVTSDPATVQRSTHVVLPGVGRFAAGVAALRRSGLDRTIHDAIDANTPLLAVCLGMQLLTEGSEESPGVAGLGIIPQRCTALPSTVRVPHLGWNGVDTPEPHRALTGGDAAFANSYCLTEAPDGWAVAWTTHGVRFLSAAARDRIVACQFHPELSGAFGLRVIDAWLRDEPVAKTTASIQAGSVAHRIVPCLDVRHGRVVKGINFQGLRDAGDPATQAAVYAAQGADEIVILDVAASPEEKRTQLAVVEAVRQVLHIPLTVGGGVRTVEDAQALLAAGADKVSVNTAAVRDPSLLTGMRDAFGQQCVVLAIDARRESDMWNVLITGGRESTGLDAVSWARDGVQHGAGEILLTSWDRDGTRSGCDLALVEAVRRAVPVPIIASGGVGTAADVTDAFRAGADAVLAASVFHDGDHTVSGIKAQVDRRGVTVRR